LHDLIVQNGLSSGAVQQMARAEVGMKEPEVMDANEVRMAKELRMAHTRCEHMDIELTTVKSRNEIESIKDDCIKRDIKRFKTLQFFQEELGNSMGLTGNGLKLYKDRMCNRGVTMMDNLDMYGYGCTPMSQLELPEYTITVQDVIIEMNITDSEQALKALAQKAGTIMSNWFKTNFPNSTPERSDRLLTVGGGSKDVITSFRVYPVSLRPDIVKCINQAVEQQKKNPDSIHSMFLPVGGSKQRGPGRTYWGNQNH
jgi:hypothetical protein